MKKRIFVSMYALSTAGILIISIILCVLFYNRFSITARTELRQRADALSKIEIPTNGSTLDVLDADSLRITLVEPDGAVTYDNTFNPEHLQNHLDREEIQAALALGWGESIRYSNTWGHETVYYAVKLSDGSVLRVAKTVQSIGGIFSGALPAIVLAILLLSLVSYRVAANLTSRILSPIRGIDLQGEPTTPYDELVPMIRTITEQRKSIDQQLLDLQNRSDTTNAIMDNMNEGILLVNKQEMILSANRCALRIFEKDSPSDDTSMVAFLRDTELIRYVRGALAGSREEMSMSRSGRTYRIYASHVSDVGAIILFWDVTEKVKAEKMRREFTANVSHELRTPLTSIYGNAEMLCNDMVKEKDRQAFYRKIKDEAGRMIALIQDILMISRLDEGGGPEQPEEVELAAIAEEAKEALTQKALENHVSITRSGADVCMQANRSMMYELFYNLIENAIKYNKPNGEVHIELSRSDSQIKIVVSDTGIGIPRQAQDRVFERFYRVDKSRFRETGGTGLGLAIVKHIVITHGGAIELQSALDKGTTITVAFTAPPISHAPADPIHHNRP